MADVLSKEQVKAHVAPVPSEHVKGASDGRVPEQSTGTVRAPLSGVGAALRVRRLAKGLSLRQFARQLGVSASFISQLENGKSQPSVATLFAICEALDTTVDELFAQSVVRPDRDGAVTSIDGGGLGRATSLPAARRAVGFPPVAEPGIRNPVVHASDRRRLVLDTGVTWERLSSRTDAPGEFLLITYEVGGSSTAGDQMSRHSGTDFGFVVSGKLTLSLGFDTFILGPTDSISFDSSIPHRLHNDGDEPVQAIWYALDDDQLAGRQPG